MKVTHHIFCLLLLLILLALAQEGELLDLTKKKISTETKKYAPGVGGLIGGSGTRSVPLPLKVGLERLDKQQYELSEQFIYEISIENVGKESLLIPWEPDREKVLKQSADVSALTLRLQIDELGEDAIFGVEQVYGAESVPDTFKTLAPGKKLRFRAGGGWFVGNEKTAKRFFQMLPNKFKVRAHVNIDSYPVGTMRFQPGLSNALSTAFRKRRDG